MCDMDQVKSTTLDTGEPIEPKNLIEDTPSQPTEPNNVLSKRQKKKLVKLQNWESRKMEKRKRERERNKMKRQEAKATCQPRLGPSRKQLKLNKIVETEDSIRIAIDLSYESLMIEKDIVKCSRQLLRCYTANRRAETPLPLYFTGMKLDTKFYAAMQKNDGFKNWDVKFCEESFEHIFPKEKIVFLTSDSDNVLDKFESGHVYVIGGLVDHNHNKGFCYEKARKLGVAHARLPLSENIDIKTRTVLTINHVFEIIVNVTDGLSWADALLKVLPSRKGAKRKLDDDNSSDEEPAV